MCVQVVFTDEQALMEKAAMYSSTSEEIQEDASSQPESLISEFNFLDNIEYTYDNSSEPETPPAGPFTGRLEEQQEPEEEEEDEEDEEGEEEEEGERKGDKERKEDERRRKMEVEKEDEEMEEEIRSVLFKTLLFIPVTLHYFVNLATQFQSFIRKKKS